MFLINVLINRKIKAFKTLKNGLSMRFLLINAFHCRDIENIIAIPQYIVVYLIIYHIYCMFKNPRFKVFFLFFDIFIYKKIYCGISFWGRIDKFLINQNTLIIIRKYRPLSRRYLCFIRFCNYPTRQP